MTPLIKFSTPLPEIGEVITVISGTDAIAISTVQGNFVRTGFVYNQSDYPKLYEKIGLIQSTVNYDIATQFYVPRFTQGSAYYGLPTYGANSAPTYITYVRAK